MNHEDESTPELRDLTALFPRIYDHTFHLKAYQLIFDGH